MTKQCTPMRKLNLEFLLICKLIEFNIKFLSYFWKCYADINGMYFIKKTILFLHSVIHKNKIKCCRHSCCVRKPTITISEYVKTKIIYNLWNIRTLFVWRNYRKRRMYKLPIFLQFYKAFTNWCFIYHLIFDFSWWDFFNFQLLKGFNYRIFPKLIKFVHLFRRLITLNLPNRDTIPNT